MTDPVCRSQPLIIAHRGGGQNWLENTLYAFQQNLAAGVDAIELDLQLTADGQLAIYHPRDLSERTEGRGPVSSKTLAEIQRLRPGMCASENDPTTAPDRDIRIPSLKEVLKEIPNIPLILDLKSLPAEPLVQALAEQIPAEEMPRLIFYSTEAEHVEALHRRLPQAIVFEDRDRTFQRLVENQPSAAWPRMSGADNLEISETTSLSHRRHNLNLGSSGLCTHPTAAEWIGFELKRKLKVQPAFSSTAHPHETEVTLWDEASVECTRSLSLGAKIVLFGINSCEEYETAMALGADAVYSDNPLRLLNYPKSCGR